MINCLDFNYQIHQADADKFIFRPGIYGVLIEDGKILLSKQFDGYDFPGGGIEINETIIEALEREFFEETGLKVKALKVLYTTSMFYYSRQGKYWNSINLYYQVQKISGELSTANFMPDEYEYMGLAEWLDISSLKDLKIYNVGITDNQHRLSRELLIAIKNIC